MVGKTLKLSMETGRVDVQGLPGEDASAEEKNDAAISLIGAVAGELDELEKQLASDPRAVVKQTWILHSVLEAHPARWLQNFAKRRERNDLSSRIENLRDRAASALPEGEGKQIWEDLPYARMVLGLLFDKLRAVGEVKRLILSPLGKLEFADIRYARDDPEDLARVCQDLGQLVRDTGDLDDRVRHWGAMNRGPLLLGLPPAVIPVGMVNSAKLGMVATLIGLIGLGGGGAILGKLVPDLPEMHIGIPVGAAIVGQIALIFGLLTLNKVRAQKAQVPKTFADLSARFRERLYLVCALRNLYRTSSRLTVTNEALNDYLKKNGGKSRWRKVKFEGRDLTELLVEGTWDPRGTVENWLSGQVTRVFRLDSTTLIPPADLDGDTWEVILKAYVLESVDGISDAEAGQKLATVGELLFTKRGEDVHAERERVFFEVRTAWDTAQREGQVV